MKRLFYVLGFVILLLFDAISCNAQSTTVSGTIQDANGQAFANGTYRIQFNPNGIAPPFQWNGSPFDPSTHIFSGVLNSSGAFSGVSVPSNAFIASLTQWNFTVCPASSSPCFTQSLVVLGATQSVSSSIAPPAIQVNSNATQPTAYTDAEIVNPVVGFQYFNLTSNVIRVCTVSIPCTWVNGAGGGAGANTALSNLATVSINTSLLAQTGVDAGSTANPFRNIFLWGTGTYGSTYMELTGAPTSTRVWTIQDATDTFVGKATTDTLTNKTLTTPTVNSATLGGASTVVPSGATLTIQSGGTLTCASGSTCPGGTVTTSGSPTSSYISYFSSATAITGTANATLDSSGNGTFAGTLNGASLTSGTAPTAAGASARGGLDCTESANTGWTATSGEDYARCDSTKHMFVISNNGGAEVPSVVGPTSATSGHIATFSGTSGGIIQDGGVVATGIVVATSPGAGLAHFAGSTQTVTSSAVIGGDMANNTVTATQLAAQYSKGSCTELWGGSGASFALTSGDDAVSNNSCYNDSGVTRTITAVKCRGSGASNTTTVNPTFGSAGTGTTILSGALTCGSSLAYSATGTVSSASWTTGTGITPVMGGSLTGTSIAMIVEYTY